MAIRSLALGAIVTSLVYLTWRATSTLDLTAWWVSIPLLVLEIHATFGLVLFTVSLWDIDRRPARRRVEAPPGRVAVLLPTYNESVEVLLPTIAAAVAMDVDHATWVLDDGDRPEIERLARDLGASYLTRPEHTHTKAGNLNHALGVVDAEFVAVLDADHVAERDFLAKTLGYFDDPGVSLVQTPQDFYNLDSFEHDGSATERSTYHEQALFYRVIQPGKNRWGGAFWCGTGAVVRMAALRQVGGVATESLTEDIHTTIRLHRLGWRTVYHNEVLARGLAAGDARTYQAQRLRWGTGAMQVLRLEHPLTRPGLSLGQRLAYAATLLGWFDAWRTLGFLVLPTAVLFTGALPIRADPLAFSVAFTSVFILQQLAIRVLSRGYHRPITSIVFELVRMSPNLAATLTLLRPGRPAFRVTPKGRTADGRRSAEAPILLVAVGWFGIAAASWFALTLAGLTPTHYEVPWAAYASFGWLLFGLWLVALAIGRVRSLKFAPERRSSVRFDLRSIAELDGLVGELRDVSLTGARLSLPVRAEGGDAHRLEFTVSGEHVGLDVILRSVRQLEDGTFACGLEFAPGQHAERARLALALFRGSVEPTAVVAGTAQPVAGAWVGDLAASAA
jgi:cellulose synthase (UDP-forming)